MWTCGLAIVSHGYARFLSSRATMGLRCTIKLRVSLSYQDYKAYSDNKRSASAKLRSCQRTVQVSHNGTVIGTWQHVPGSSLAARISVSVTVEADGRCWRLLHNMGGRGSRKLLTSVL